MLYGTLKGEVVVCRHKENKVGYWLLAIVVVSIVSRLWLCTTPPPPPPPPIKIICFPECIVMAPQDTMPRDAS